MYALKNQTVARQLLEARQSGRLLTKVEEDALPIDVTDAYEIQDIVTQALGTVGGWKVGARAPGAQPTCAPLPAQLICESPCHVKPSSKGRCAIEAELAVRLKHDLPPKPEPYTRNDVIAAAASVHAVIEVVDSRFVDSSIHPMLSLADNLSNGMLIVGTGRQLDLEVDQCLQPVELFFDAEQVAAAIGGNPVGDIWALVVWLANHAAQRCGGLRAGQIITTGSCTGLTFAKSGTRVKAFFPSIGVVEMLVD